MAYLDDHPPRLRQFRDRGTTASGVIVIHTAESQPDETGPDTGAENVANFIRDRTNYGSYHRLCDSDSIIPLVRFDQQAYGDGTGSNPHAIHIAAATQAARWPTLSDEWVEATVTNMARAAVEASEYVHSLHGVYVPVRRITRPQSDRRIEGFISHGERDPERRSDPGPAFPWDYFLNQYRALSQEDDMFSDEDRKMLRETHRITLGSRERERRMLKVLKKVRGRVNDRPTLAEIDELLTESEG